MRRGRLNVLCTLLDKPPGALFAQMNNAQSQFHVGDVKYHLGQSGLLSFPTQVGFCALQENCGLYRSQRLTISL